MGGNIVAAFFPFLFLLREVHMLFGTRLRSIGTACCAVICMLFLYAGQAANAQTNALCDPGTCGAPWVAGPGSPLTFTLTEGCVVQVTYETRICNGVPEYRVVSTTIINDPFGQSNCDQISPSALAELVDIQLIANSFAFNIPNCPEQSPQIVKVYQGSCIYRKTCKLTYTTLPTIVCDPIGSGLPPDNPDPLNITLVEYIPCGTTCCSRAYTLCRSVNPSGSPTSYIKIRRVSTVNTGCQTLPGALNSCIPICN